MKKYPVSQEMQKRLENEQTYHAPTADQVERLKLIRDEILRLKLLLVELSPYSREQSLALTELDYANLMCNAAMLRHESETDD